MAARRQSNWAWFLDAMREPSDPLFGGSAMVDPPSRLSSANVPPSVQDAITGTEGNDFLQGTANADTIDGLGGHDFIRGLGGDDILNGGTGGDFLEGGVNGNRDLDLGSDTLFGGDGDDLLRGGAGFDVYDGGAGFDRVSFFLFGATQAVVANLATQTISNDGFGNAETMISIEGLGSGTIFADTFTGNDDINLLIGDVGDTLASAGGDDVFSFFGAPASVDGGAGLDTIIVFSLAKLVADTNGDGFAEVVNATHGVIVDLSTQSIVDDGFGGSGALTSIERVGGSLQGDTITGNDQQDRLTGYLGDDQLNGGVGADTLFGDAGADTLNGGDGNDVLHGAGVSGIALGSGGVARLPGAGNVDFATALDISNEFIGGDLACSMQAQANGDGAVHVYKVNLLNFGASITLNPFSLSGAPIRVSVFDSLGNSVGGGTAGSITATVGAPAGPLGFGGGQPGVYYLMVAAPDGTGLLPGQNYFLNVAVANELDFGADTLNGGAGADLMIGGWGNDTYFVDDIGDAIVEVGPSGQIVDGFHLVDTVNASIDYFLNASLENLTLIGAGAINGVGTDIANIINGNSAANQLFGLAGDDTINGGAGADQMFGGLGDDHYFVDDMGDVTFEAQSAWGVDFVEASVSYALGRNIDNLTLVAGSGAINGLGNALANDLVGNENANALFGFAGNDRLGDVFVLGGPTSIDQMYGGEGDDQYFVDNSADVTFEANVAWGTDTVVAFVDYQLGTNIDNLTLLIGQRGLGNGLANTIIGNGDVNMLFGFAGNDVIDGSSGADQMFGGLGDDTYWVDDSLDVVFEAQSAWGVDLVLSLVTYALGTNIDNLTLVGAANIDGAGNGLANVITGNIEANMLNGLAGNDTLNGAGGNDTLFGGAGDDAFVFGPGSGSDTVGGFIAGGVEDTINLQAYNGSGVTWTITQVGADTVFAFSNGDQITLTNVVAANLVHDPLDPFLYG